MSNRASKLTIGYNPDWKRQSAIDVPMAGTLLTKAFPATSRNYIDINETVEDIYDCTGEDFLFEILTNRQARLTIDMDVDPEILAGISAYAFGVAGSPSGGTNEVQTETVTATGGTRILVITKGADQQPTSPIPFNAVAADIQTALEALSNVEPGDISVTGTGPYVYTFGGNLQKQEVPAIMVYTYGLTGGTSTFAETTPGVGRSHELDRVAGVVLPFTTFYIGFRDSGKQPIIFKNVTVNTLRVRSSNNGGAGPQKVTATFELIGSADFQYATGYTMPPCQDILPIRFGDCGMNVAGRDLIAEQIGREFEFFYQNDVALKYDGSGPDFTRAERADKRPSGMTWFFIGEDATTDQLFTWAKEKTTLPVSLRIGPATRKITYIVPSALWRFAASPVRFNGDPAEEEVAVVVRPRKISGNSMTPIYAQAVTGQQTPYLVAAT